MPPDFARYRVEPGEEDVEAFAASELDQLSERSSR
jgi:hypothetical protein